MFKIKTFICCTGFALTLFISCNNHNDTKQNSNIDDTILEENTMVKSKLIEAKETQKIIFQYIEQAETKKITKKQLDRMAKPLQRHLDSLGLVLNANEKKELKDYGIMLVNEMIDRKIARENK
jgi:hypothetical protein